MFELEKVDFDIMGDLIEEFYHQCYLDGSVNNSSKQAMKVGVFDDDHWWAYLYKGKVISMSGCYKTDDFGQGGWRLLFRSVTLKKYRGKAGTFSRDLNHDFCFGHLLNAQKNFINKKKTRLMFFTTNSSNDGDAGSLKANRYVEKILYPRGRVKLLKSDYSYFYCKQNIWQIL